MTCDVTIEGAERASRGRAMLMAIAAAVLLINAAIQWGNQSTSEKIASTGQPSARASLSASVAEGTKTPFSTVLTVLRLTPTISASAAWVRPCSARRSRSRFEISPAIAPS